MVNKPIAICEYCLLYIRDKRDCMKAYGKHFHEACCQKWLKEKKASAD